MRLYCMIGLLCLQSCGIIVINPTYEKNLTEKQQESIRPLTFSSINQMAQYIQSEKIDTNQIYTINSKEVNDLKEKLNKQFLVINIGSYWCKPCGERFPELIDVLNKHEININTIHVSPDNYIKSNIIKSYFKKQGVLKNYFMIENEMHGQKHEVFTRLSSFESGVLSEERKRKNSGVPSYLVLDLVRKQVEEFNFPSQVDSFIIAQTLPQDSETP